MRRHTMPKLFATASFVALAMAFTGAASASPIALPHVVSADPANFTPDVTTGKAVYKMLQVGSTMFAGGDFSQVTDSNGLTHNRTHLFAFNASTGAITNFAPTFDAPVWGLASDGTSLWVGGNFKNVNGTARRALVKLDPTTGAVDTAFNAKLKGNVEDVQMVGTQLIAGGKFAKRLQAINPATGADTGLLDLGISGTVASNAGATDVYRFAVNPDATRLVAIGNFTTVGGQAKARAFMVNLNLLAQPPVAALSSWYYPELAHACRASKLPAQLRDVEFSSDGSFFVMVATGFIPQVGHELHKDICDATARFDTNILGPTSPVWINYTGGDTLHSVAVTGNAATGVVYLQGHNRWVSSTGTCPAACVVREGIAALNASNGTVVETWNPGKVRGVGGKDLYVTPAGLWVASDTTRIGGEIHERIALMPLL